MIRAAAVLVVVVLAVVMLAAPAAAQFAPLAGNAGGPVAAPSSQETSQTEAIEQAALAVETARAAFAVETARNALAAAARLGSPEKRTAARDAALTALQTALTRSTTLPAELTQSPFLLSRSQRAVQRQLLEVAIQTTSADSLAATRTRDSTRTARDLHALAEAERTLHDLEQRLETYRRRLVDNGRAEESVRPFPVARTNEEATQYFGADFEAVGQPQFSLLGETSGLFVPFYSDNAHIGRLFGLLPLGYARVGFGAFVQSGPSEDSTATDSTATASDDAPLSLTAGSFLSNGGNAALHIALPLVDARFLSKSETGPPRHDLNLGVLLLPRAAAQFPRLNGSATATTWNAEVALEARLSFTTVQDIFRLYATGHAAYVAGSSDFYTELDTPGAFGYLRGDFGVDIAGQFRIGIRRAWFGPDSLQQGPVALTLQLLKTAGSATP